MTRIIAGSAGGRRISTPKGELTRPTSDRVREALFSSVEAWAGALSGLRVLDLYAGSGALGLEAWSRGAEEVWLVESDRPTAALIQSNARALGCPVAQVRAANVHTFLAQAPPEDGFDLVLADPPYPLSREAVERDLTMLTKGWLADDALVIVERGRRGAELTWPVGFEPRKPKKYGESVLLSAHWPGSVSR